MGRIRFREMDKLYVDVVLRMIFFIIFIVLERATPFFREIQPEEMWLYKYPHLTSYVPVTYLWPLVLLAPAAVIAFFYWRTKDQQDLLSAVLALTLGLTLNGAVTDIIKVIVGRPRPDFFWRCFPDGIAMPDMKCTGPHDLVIDGRKSFPSGHSSFSFAGLSFVSLYLAGKLRTFSRQDGSAWRLIAVLTPLIMATCIALSRTCDYHHHWQDILVGSLLGSSISTMSYRLYFPHLSSQQCHKPFSAINSVELNPQSEPLIPEEVKWI